MAIIVNVPVYRIGSPRSETENIFLGLLVLFTVSTILWAPIWFEVGTFFWGVAVVGGIMGGILFLEMKKRRLGECFFSLNPVPVINLWAHNGGGRKFEGKMVRNVNSIALNETKKVWVRFTVAGERVLLLSNADGDVFYLPTVLLERNERLRTHLEIHLFPLVGVVQFWDSYSKKIFEEYFVPKSSSTVSVGKQ